MDLKKIKEIVNSNLPHKIQESAILSVLSHDEKVIPHMLEILENERNHSKELLLDTNVELSRALVTLDSKPTTPSAKRDLKEQTTYVVGEIKNHYLKWEDYIKCCFKVQGLP